MNDGAQKAAEIAKETVSKMLLHGVEKKNKFE